MHSQFSDFLAAVVLTGLEIKVPNVWDQDKTEYKCGRSRDLQDRS